MGISLAGCTVENHELKDKARKFCFCINLPPEQGIHNMTSEGVPVKSYILFSPSREAELEKWKIGIQAKIP